MFNLGAGSKDAEHIPVTALSLANDSSPDTARSQAMARTVSILRQDQPHHYLLNS